MVQGCTPVNRGSAVLSQHIFRWYIYNYPRTCLLVDVRLIGCRKSEIDSKA